MEEEKVEEPPQSTDSEDDGGAKTEKESRGRTKVGLNTGKGDKFVEETGVAVLDENPHCADSKRGSSRDKKKRLRSDSYRSRGSLVRRPEDGFTGETGFWVRPRIRFQEENSVELVTENDGLHMSGSSMFETSMPLSIPIAASGNDGASVVCKKKGNINIKSKHKNDKQGINVSSVGSSKHDISMSTQTNSISGDSKHGVENVISNSIKEVNNDVDMQNGKSEFTSVGAGGNDVNVVHDTSGGQGSIIGIDDAGEKFENSLKELNQHTEVLMKGKIPEQQVETLLKGDTQCRCVRQRKKQLDSSNQLE